MEQGQMRSVAEDFAGRLRANPVLRARMAAMHKKEIPFESRMRDSIEGL